MKKLNILLAGVLATATLLAGCTNSGSSSAAPESAAPEAGSIVESAPVEPTTTGEGTVLRVGASPTPHAQILEQVIDDLADQGITLVISEFNDYVLPNTAVDDGSLDANFFQHLPYLEDFNANNGTDLVSVAAIHVEPMGIYGGKAESLDEIATGAKVGIPGDSTNGGRALLLLESLGLITLKEDAGIEATIFDIVEDPYALDFVELEAAQLPATLPDLDFAVINGNYAQGAGIADQALANEGADSPYANIIAIKAGDENRPEIVALIEALQSDAVRGYILDTFGGEVLPVF